TAKPNRPTIQIGSPCPLESVLSIPISPKGIPPATAPMRRPKRTPLTTCFIRSLPLRLSHRPPLWREASDEDVPLPVADLLRRVVALLALLEEQPQRWQQRPSGQRLLRVLPRAPISTCSALRTSRGRRGEGPSPRPRSPGLIW